MPSETSLAKQTEVDDALMPDRLGEMTESQVAQTVDKIGRAAEARRQIVTAAAKFTRWHDWQNLGGKLYLEGEGAMRLAGAVGLAIGAPIFEVEECESDYFVECMVTVTWPATGFECTEIGSCNTRDKFWNSDSERSQINQNRMAAGGNEKLARRMLLGSVKKKAHANAISRCVTSIMGLRGLTPDDLKHLGFTVDQAGSNVQYKTQPTPQAAPAQPRSSAPQEDDGPPPVSKILTVSEADAANLGDHIAVTGAIVSTYDNPKNAKYVIGDGSKMIDVIIWTADPPLPEATSGKRVTFPSVEVREFRGKKQYIAQTIQIGG